jgi:hypothetical protein
LLERKMRKSQNYQMELSFPMDGITNIAHFAGGRFLPNQVTLRRVTPMEETGYVNPVTTSL